MYIGSLRNLDGAQRQRLVFRMNQLLLGQYHDDDSCGEIESLAISYVGKLKSRQKGDRGPGEKVEVSGGLLDEDEHAGINLKTFRTIEAREGGGVYLCHQVIELLGIPCFLAEQGLWTSAQIEWMLLNLQGTRYRSGRRPYGLKSNPRQRA